MLNVNFRINQEGFKVLKKSILHLSIVIPFKNNEKDKKRAENLLTTISYYKEKFPDSEVIVVEQYEKEPYYYDDKVKKVNLQSDTAINKAKLLNRGWREAKNEVILFCDNDYILQEIDIISSVQLIQKKGYDIIKPYTAIYNVSSLFNQETVKDISKIDLKTCEFENAYIPLTGGSFLCSRAFYEKMGGFDERFIGWGGEDDASSIVAINIGKYCAIDSYAIHLYHEKAKNQNVDHFRMQHVKNIRLVNEIIRKDQIGFELYVEELRKNLKNLE